ncbi:MAG: hypothetical protein HQL36_11005 [Alphaproteobacteria bacterium]|nr:hypothetical protein [Alphaproteobacteria bacterium]
MKANLLRALIGAAFVLVIAPGTAVSGDFEMGYRAVRWNMGGEDGFYSITRMREIRAVAEHNADDGASTRQASLASSEPQSDPQRAPQGPGHLTPPPPLGK